MRNSLGIFKRDMKTIFTNYAVLITVIALCILPSLYAWINIMASWDPYSAEATSRIKVAVVNNDQGAVVQGKEINMGEKVVEGLRKNTLLGWEFMPEDQAMKELRIGKVYAAIVIPKNFSSDLSSLVTNNIREAKIKYIVNEKLNAIAPKITSKGASGIQSTVSSQVVSTVSNTVLEMAKELGIEVEDIVLPKLVQAGTMLHDIEGRFQEVNDLINLTEQGIVQFETVLDQVTKTLPDLEKLLVGTQGMVTSVDDFMNTVEVGVDTLAPTIKKDIGLINEISGQMYTYTESLSQMIASGSSEVPGMLENMQQKAEAMDKLVSSLVKIIRGIQGITGTDSLANVLSRFEAMQTKISTIKDYLETINSAVANGQVPDQSLLNKVMALLQDVGSISGDLYDQFDTEIMPKIDAIFDKTSVVTDSASTVVSDAKDKLPDVISLVVKAQEVAQKGTDSIETVKKLLPEVEEKVRSLSAKIDEINRNQQLRDLIDLIKEDVMQRSEFLAGAAKIEEETIFPMGNYGSQMAPFYSSLAAWVGLTILVSMISVEAKGEYKSYEVYFGKLFTYLAITTVQGIIIGLGDLFLLKIYCLNPWLFMLGMFATTVSFTFIVYSLVSVFGNVGKVAAIILMILQVAGSGGTFPVQLTSNFFIAINPYLPFTYSISLLREAIGGVEQSILNFDFIALGIFIAGFVILSVVLKKYINKALEGFVHKVHESGL